MSIENMQMKSIEISLNSCCENKSYQFANRTIYLQSHSHIEERFIKKILRILSCYFSFVVLSSTNRDLLTEVMNELEHLSVFSLIFIFLLFTE